MISRPHFNSFLVSKKENKLNFVSFQNYESRNESTFKSIQEADKLYNFKDFDWILINTDDRDYGNRYQNLKMFSYSTSNENYDHVCPDFVFDCWKEVQIDEYEKVVDQICQLSDTKPLTDLLGWRGALTHPSRFNLLKFTDKSIYDIEEIVWNRSDPKKLTCVNYVSLTDSVKNWRYLIDVEGNGYSARVKFFLFSKRVLFLQSRPYKEWYYQDLKPWTHFVPIRHDLSDLDEKLQIIKNDPKLEEEICNNAFDFAQKNLKKTNALDRWKFIIEQL